MYCGYCARVAYIMVMTEIPSVFVTARNFLMSYVSVDCSGKAVYHGWSCSISEFYFENCESELMDIW